MDKLNLAGKTFGQICVISCAKNKGRRTMWNCSCVCGQKFRAETTNIKNGNTKSCGCRRRQVARKTMFKHGYCTNYSHAREWRIWSGMKTRCSNQKRKDYHQYGGRGISVCRRWVNSFKHFIVDMGNCPKDFTLERLNVNGNYTPKNCKWVSRKEQVRNRRH